MIDISFAPAKVNLYLRVGAPGADGYHPISTLAVFADVGDRIGIEEAGHASLAVTGPFAASLEDEPDNLVLRAARAFELACGVGLPPLRITIDKQLPVAAGLGGGSSDAAAVLRLLRDRYGPGMTDPQLAAVALELGADGPMCLAARPVIARGRGERLTPVAALPELWAVLVNPLVESPTAAVYRRFDELGVFADLDTASLAPDFDPVELPKRLESHGNDLEAAAVSRDPRIGEPIGWLKEQPEAQFARLSGSGATSFALCPDEAAALALAARLAREQPRWWSRVCRLGGPRVSQARNH